MSKPSRKKKHQVSTQGRSDGIQLFTDTLTGEATRLFQQQLRGSPLWGEWVAQYGENRAEEILLQCRADVRPGPGPSHFSDTFLS